MSGWLEMCRNCGGETFVAPHALNTISPDSCRWCHGTDLVRLAHLSLDELEAIEMAIRERGT